jgi:hypothetical protein
VSDGTSIRGCGNGSGPTAPGVALPVNPFWAPRYHFGMLLGVDDFETEQAYHRGKLRLHNAWLHGEGVVWGMGVDLPEVDGDPDALRGEVRVHPGLALDAAGRELYLEVPMCVDLAAWYRENRDDPDLREVVREEEDGTVVFDAHVVACFRACLGRPVPAISEPCERAGSDTAYSRAQETVSLRLVPGPAPEREGRYPRLRLLFGIGDPREDEAGETLDADEEVLDARAEILALPEADQPRALLEAFRRFAALDEIELRPATIPDHGETLLFPAGEDRCVVLANVLEITLGRDEDGDPVFESARVDPTVRPAHVATSTIQELLAGRPAAGGEGGGGGGEAPAPDEPGRDAGGPRIDRDSVEVKGERVEMVASPRVSPGSLSVDAFSVMNYDRNDGWHELEIVAPPHLDEDDPSRIVLHLKNAGRGSVVRVIARGTGPRPLLGLRGVPLAGARGGPPGTAHDGNDFVCMIKLPTRRRR